MKLKPADEICRSAASVPAWLMASEQAPEGGAVLERFINRIRGQTRHRRGGVPAAAARGNTAGGDAQPDDQPSGIIAGVTRC